MSTRAVAMTETSVVSPLVHKLATIAPLTDEDRAELHALVDKSREMAAKRTIIREGDRPEQVHLIVDGWACRYKLLANGARQITAFLIPGDFCDLHVGVLREMDHSIATVITGRVAFVERRRMEALTQRPTLLRAFWWSTLVDEAMLRAWIVNTGRRDAQEAIGHLLCELYVRMRNVGLTTDHSYDLPLTQEEIADALGLTPVHVNRVLQRMRAQDLISLRQGVLTIRDYRRLEQASGFSPNYLHIEPRAAIDPNS